MTLAIKAVLFDIDGTLVDSNDYHVTAWQQAFQQFDAHFTDEQIHEQIGKGSDMLLPTLLPDRSEEEHTRIAEAHGKAFKSQYLEQVKPFPAARELLVRVHQAGQKVVLASSASAEELEHYEKLLDVEDIVFTKTTADDVENTKPAPDIFSVAMKKVAPLEPGELIVVGDTPYDIEAAGKCGIAAIGLRSGKFADEDLKQAGAVALYDDVATLLTEYDASPMAK